MEEIAIRATAMVEKKNISKSNICFFEIFVKQWNSYCEVERLQS